MILKLGEEQSKRVVGENFNAIRLDFHLKHDTNNTDLTSAMFDASKIDVRGTLSKKILGREVVNLAGKVERLAIDSLLIARGQNSGAMALLDISYANQKVAKDTSVKNERSFTIFLPTGMIELDGNDSYTIDVDFSSAFSVGGVLSTSGTTCEVSVVSAIGRMRGVEVVKEISIQGEQSKYNTQLGNNVISCTFINDDITDQLSASAVIENCTLTSKEKNYKLDDAQLFGQTQAMFSDSSLRQVLDSKYVLHSGHPITNVALDFDLVASNNNSGSNVLVVRTLKTNSALMASAGRKDQKFRAINSANIVKG